MRAPMNEVSNESSAFSCAGVSRGPDVAVSDIFVVSRPPCPPAERT